ncbi:MAG: RHS repeat protein [Sphingobacteriales bacterium]|nr:RHS repeat protein [Sphingobacteriales bacterium]
MFLQAGRRLIMAAVLMLVHVAMYAGNNPEYRQTLFGKNGQLTAGAQLYTFDINYEAYKNSPGTIEKTWYVKNAVRLMVDEESSWFIASDFIATIKLNISSENAAGVVTTHPQKTLTINYKTGEGQISDAISSYEFRDAVKVTVTIAEAVTKNVSWDVTKNLKLVNEIVSLRDWGFNCSSVISGIVTDSLFYDEWKVKWNVPANFQTEYDVEWAWVDESAVPEYTFNGVVNLDSVFDNNATRVSTSGNFYRIPLLYEDEGRLYMRVRMTQDKVNGQRVEGNWFYLMDGGQAYLPRIAGQGHQDNLNWQATTSYAEEGKRKTVIQYFDGTLRGRQTVTKDNVTRSTVVAESFYDYQGRPLIQVLPSPTLGTILQFTKNFNQFDDTRNAKTVYDKLDVNQSACGKLTAAMKTTATGSAAQYYSGSNPFANDGFNKFIPDAGGYPYTETRYTRDGTGRIDAQGGVGQVFQVNGGRDTRYFYESADQDDLDALFGTDAGYASHYSKTWVRDANGQYSVSYVDMRGKTVATALAGDNPGNLQALPSYASAQKTITRQLIDGETNNVHGNSIVSSKSLVVPKQGSYTFNYALSPEKLKLLLCNGVQFCFDCQYELNISIIPDCSDKVIPGFTSPVVVKNFTIGEYLTSCVGNNAPGISTQFTVTLPEGGYTVVKELKMNTAARDWYRENVYLTNDTCKTKASFIQQQYQLALGQQNCYTSCTQCNAILGTESQFIDRFRTESGFTQAQIDALMPQLQAAYAEAKVGCDRICDNGGNETLDELNSVREIMLQDVTPLTGQYGRWDETNLTVSMRPYNIFSSAPQVSFCLGAPSVLRQPYRYPVDYSVATGAVVCNTEGYKNGYGLVTLSTNRVQNINFTPDSLADNFEQSYAYQLLPYHPEFPKLKFVESNLKGTYRFGGRLLGTETWSQAVSRGFIQSSTTSATVAADFLMQKDSFFIRTGFTHPLYYQMRDAITSNYIAANAQCGSPALGMWQLAKYSVFCSKEIRENGGQIVNNGCFTVNPVLSACLNSQNNLPPSALSHCDADMDRVWKNFKALYNSYRNILISKYITDNVAGIDYSIFDPASGNNYQERFVRYTSTPPYTLINMSDLGGLFTSSADPGSYSNVSSLEADSICRSNSGNWMIRLRRCPQVQTLAQSQSAQWIADSSWLSKYLVDVCKQGVDYMGHPFGAASVPDSKPSIQILTNPDGVSVSGVFVRSFPDIIRYYLIYRFGNNVMNQFCYPELIDYPKAYNQAPATVSTPIVTVPEPCVCDRINYYKTKWQMAGSPGTFSNYLLNTQGTVISADTLNMLLGMCNTGYTTQSPNCNYLPAPVKIPAIFQCRGTASLDSSKTCISCADYTAIKQQFLAERGVTAPYNTPQNETEVAWNRSFAEYANYRTGFGKNWPEYVQFGIICANDSTLSCTNLTSLVTAWQATNPPQTGDSCRSSFTQYMNYHTGRSLSFNQWMDEFVKACGAKPPVCQPVLTCMKLESLINSYYQYYGYQIWRNSNCQTLFTQFINDSLYSNYTYQDIINNYNFLCGGVCPLNICSFPNPHLLTLMYNTFRTQQYQGGWTLTQCQDNFTSWFNTQLGFTSSPYTWTGITELYQLYMGKESCVPDINQLCAPPYSCSQLDYIRQQFYAQNPGVDSLSNCQSLFTAYFNQQLGTGYNFSEIQTLYQAICQSTLLVCTGATLDCKAMILFTQTYTPCAFGDECVCFLNAFNTQFGTSIATYALLQQYYLDHCGFVLNICPVESPVFTCEMLQATLQKFNKLYPGGGAGLGADCQLFYAAFFNNTYAVKYSFSAINDLYLVQCGQGLQVCQSQCGEYINFVDNYMSRYGGLNIPLAARRQLFESLFNSAFGYTGGASEEKGGFAGGGNSPLVYAQIKSLMAGCLTMPSSLEAENLYLSLNDPAVLRDFKTAYYLRYPAGVPLDCQNDFAAWVNWSMGVNMTYCQLIDLYNGLLGAGAGDICGASPICAGAGAVDDGKGIVIGGGGSTAVSYPPMLCGLNEEIFTPPPVDTSTCKDPLQFAIRDANVKWELYLDSLRRGFDTAYISKCMGAKYLESFTVSFTRSEHHYTLYYYDQAGQLVRTVPPEGVEDRRADVAFLASVKSARNSNQATPVRPSHSLATDYRYNTLGQVVQQKSPDGGLSKFWYDALGRLVVSQNAKQLAEGKYSYTLYDGLGRISEVGQKPQGTVMTQTISRNQTSLAGWMAAGSSKEQITRTVYDRSYFDGDDLLSPEKLSQRNLRNRVSYTQVFDVQPAANNYIGTHRAATYYSYDIHGNVDTLLQDYGSASYYPNIMNQNNNRYKKIAYNYDLISGKVNMVSYQPGYVNPLTGLWVNNADRFYHRYSYDAENKLTDVFTSHDSLIWERDASYSYYKHGPLARTVLGQQQVQGIDYAYNLQGWLKGVNATAVGDGTYDMGQDGKIGGSNALIARDAYGFSMNYFTTTINSVAVSDYKSINTGVTPFVAINNANANTGKPLFNGNISSFVVNIPKLGEAKVYQYGYDQLNRLLAVDVFEGINITTNNFTPVALNDYKERLTYSANGNIQSYLRNGSGATVNLNNFSYSYTSGTNRLASINNSVNTQTRTYSYDAIGNTTADGMQGATNILWNVYGKVQSLTNGQGQSVSYTYDGGGNRISKSVAGTTEWYVRDASGNNMATYTETGTINNGNLTVMEWYKYGSGLLSISTMRVNMEQSATGDITIMQRGNDGYILTDHLVNTRVVITDRKLQHTANGTTVDYYITDVKTSSYYSSYGATAKSYNQQPLVAFNGQRKSNEIGADAQTALYWEYNGDVGRRWNIDPIYKNSPYSVYGGNPVWKMDYNGLDTVSNWQDAKKGDVWGNVRGNSTFWYEFDGEKWNSKGTTEISPLQEIVVVAKQTDSKKWVNSNFQLAFVGLVSNKTAIPTIEALLEGTGVSLAEAELSSFRFLGPAAAIATLPFTLSSDNISQPDLIRQTDQIINEYLKKGDLAGAQSYIETYNRDRGRQGYSKIVFRYMSLGEYNSRLTPDGDLPQALPFDASNDFVTKYITPDIYLTSKGAKTYLALPRAPDIAIWTYEVEIAATKMPATGYQIVKPKHREPGGGREATILQPFPIHGFFPLIQE